MFSLQIFLRGLFAFFTTPREFDDEIRLARWPTRARIINPGAQTRNHSGPRWQDGRPQDKLLALRSGGCTTFHGEVRKREKPRRHSTRVCDSLVQTIRSSLRYMRATRGRGRNFLSSAYPLFSSCQSRPIPARGVLRSFLRIYFCYTETLPFVREYTTSHAIQRSRSRNVQPHFACTCFSASLFLFTSSSRFALRRKHFEGKSPAESFSVLHSFHNEISTPLSVSLRYRSRI